MHEEGRIIGFFDADYPSQKLVQAQAKSDAQLSAELMEHEFWLGTKRAEQVAVAVEPGLVTRTLEAEFPKQVELGVLTSLIVSISGTVAGAGGLPIAVPVGTTVDIVVQPRRGFAVEGRAEASLRVGEEETLPVQFRVRGTAVGPGELRVLAFHQGPPLGAITLRPLVVAAAPQESQRDSHSGALAPANVRVPDVTLLIEEHDDRGRPAFLFRLYPPYLDRPHTFTKFGPIPLQTDATVHFDAFFREIEGLRLDDGTQRAIAEEQLKAKGAKLFEQMFPPDLRKIIWDLRDHNLSMLVQSEEPWIPWELCRLFGEAEGDIQDGPFLCEALHRHPLAVRCLFQNAVETDQRGARRPCRLRTPLRFDRARRHPGAGGRRPEGQPDPRQFSGYTESP